MKLKDLILSTAMGGACLCLITAGAPSSAWAQQAAGSITGTVTDPAGAALANVTITATDIDRGTTWSTKTSSAGIYEFPQIPAGNIRLKVEASGFAKELRNPFALVLNQVARIDFHLQVGTISESIDVNAAPPLLQTASTELGTVIDAKAATSLPLSTRDINQLTLLVPGVVSPNIFAFQSPQTTFGTGRPYVNGAREQDNNFTLDGMDVNQADNNDVAYVPGPDAVQEFNVITSNAPADFGNYIGGVIVETLKSGTNHYHGNLFEFLRNTDLNANSWQNNALGVKRNPLQWNEFGGTIGGPILRDKLFFFADVQTSLYNTPANSTAFAPIPAAFRTGDFSSLCTSGFTPGGLCNTPTQQLYDPASSSNPATRTPFLNNQVPIRSAAAGKILSSPLFPSASATTYLQHSYVNSYQGDLKIDWQATQKDHIMGRYSQMYTINNTTNSIALLPSLTRDYPLKNFVFDYSRAISPTLVNELRVGFQDFPANDQQYTNPTGQNLPVQFGIPGVQDSVLPDLNFNELYSDIGNADLVEIFHDTTLEGEDSLTWTHGKHIIHGGFEYFHYIMNDLYPGNQGVAGQFTFTGQFTGNNALGTSGGDPVADFLLGLPEEVQAGSAYRFHLRNSLVGGFLQDNWQIAHNLTLNIGLRYELTTPRGDKNPANNINFNELTGAPEIGMNYKTYTGRDNFQPRVGFAWQPTWAPQTVVRGAYDISTYMEGNGIGNMAVINPPNVVTHTEQNLGLAEPTTTLDQGYASFPSSACQAVDVYTPGCLSSATVHETNPNLQPAVDQQWNITVQHQFGAHTTASAGYVGNKVDHMTDLDLWNQLQLLPGGATAPGPFSQSLVNPSWATASTPGASVRYSDSSAIQRYNAFELTIAQRNFHGLDLQASYTLSRCMSNSLGFFGMYGDEEGVGVSQTNGGYFFFQNMYDQKADYGRCITDTPQNFDGYVVYDLPFGKGRQFANSTNKVVDTAIGGWSIATNFTFHSGFAIDPSGPDESGTGSVDARPNCVPGVSQYGNNQFENIGGSLGRQFLNPAAVTTPAAGTFGNCQVGAFRGPGLKTDDLNLTKTIPVTERFNLLFMAQFINVTNTPIWSAPASGCGPSCNGVITTGPTGGGAGTAGSFGLIQSQDPGRQIQFALKLNY